MIRKQLELLSTYIKDLEKRDPLDVFCEYLKNIEQQKEESQTYLQMNQRIQRDMKRLLDSWRENGWSDEVVFFTLSQVLFSFAKKQSIHAYAYALGLEPSLYKDEMRLLFKGKKE